MSPNTPKPRTLAVREIHGHVTITPTAMTAWYVLTPQRWSFRSDTDRAALIEAYATRLSHLAGREVVIRVTNRPMPAKEWARRLHHASPDALPGWSDTLTADQRLLLTGTTTGAVFLGVTITSRPWYARATATMRGTVGAAPDIARQARVIDRVTAIAAGPGMDARPAQTSEIEWLLHRSIRLGLPAPRHLSTVTDEPWTMDDLQSLTEDVSYEWSRWDRTVKVSAVYPDPDGGDLTLTRYVAVLVLGRVPRLTIPRAADPWLQTLDRFPYPIEVLSRMRLMSGPETKKSVEGQRLKIRNQQAHYAEHGLDAPADLSAKADHSLRIDWETSGGHGDVVTPSRAYGWHRIAVMGNINDPDPTVCLDRVAEVTAWMADSYQMTLVHPTGRAAAAAQFPLLTEFTPGEPQTSTAYQRRVPTRYVAAALPHVAATVGDDRGPLTAHTAGSSRRPVFFDPHFAMEEVEASGLVPIVGNQGAGKSVLAGFLAHESIRRGIVTTVLDPASLLARLATVPTIRDHTRVVDLMDGADGVLSPYAVVAEPTVDDVDGRRMAAQTRKMLARDVVEMLLPDGVAKMQRTPLVVQDAIRRVPTDRTSSLNDVIAALRTCDDTHGKVIADYLAELADMPFSRLFYGNSVLDDDAEHTDTGLILAMSGLQLPPPGKAAGTLAEQLSVPVLHLATHYATRRVYSIPRGQRKMLALDEAGLVADWHSGRSMFQQLGRNSRKLDLSAIVASQNGRDVLGMDVANFVSTAFVGRTEDETTAVENLRLLGVPPGGGYETHLQRLSGATDPTMVTGRARQPREFVMRDVFGRVEKIRIDLSHRPGLLDALDTTPRAVRDAVVA